MTTELCKMVVFNICYVESNPTANPIFGFSEFISAFSLLMVLYTITDILYKFRISIASTSFKKISLIDEVFILSLLIAVGTLWSDFSFEKKLLMPSFLSNQANLQIIFAISFVALLFNWIWCAFIKPPVFGKKNYQRFIDNVYYEIVKGSSVDLPIIANELSGSARNIVKYSDSVAPETTRKIFDVGRCAYELILLIGNRKICKYIVSNTPITAIAIFEEAAKNNKYGLPLSTFAKNVAAEAFLNKDSILYHEDEGYNSGLIGYIKPFSKAIFGNSNLVGSLSPQTPFDIDYETLRSLDSEQLEVYTKSFLIFISDCLENSTIDKYQTTFNRTLRLITGRCTDAYKLNKVSDFYNIDVYKRIAVVSKFIKDLIDLLGKKDKSLERRNLKSYDRYNDYYDVIAESMKEILENIASIKEPIDTSWWIQHNTVWNDFFIWYDKQNYACKIIHYRLRRLIYSEIKRLEDIPNYLSIKVLGLCLNVMGLKTRNEKGLSGYLATNALHKCILTWSKKNYMEVRDKNIDVAQNVLIGSISFASKINKDGNEKNYLVKTYAKALNLEAPKEYLELDCKLS